MVPAAHTPQQSVPIIWLHRQKTHLVSELGAWFEVQWRENGEVYMDQCDLKKKKKERCMTVVRA